MILLQVILIALNAVFACAEIAVLSVNETKISRMAEEGDRRAARLVRLVGQPSRFLSTIQVAITLSGFLGSAFAADNFSDPLVDFVLSLGVPIPRAVLNSVSVVLITVILSYFTLVFGELVPKRIAMRKTEAVALGISGLYQQGLQAGRLAAHRLGQRGAPSDWHRPQRRGGGRGRGRYPPDGGREQ